MALLNIGIGLNFSNGAVNSLVGDIKRVNSEAVSLGNSFAGVKEKISLIGALFEHEENKNKNTTVKQELDLSKIKMVKTRPLSRADAVRERRAERIERNKEFKQIIQSAKAKGIKYNEVQRLRKPHSEQQIIEKLGAPDPTAGACSSQALAYIANKFGFDVKDYRKMKSRALFADRNTIRRIVESGGFEVDTLNGFENAERLLQHVETGKEYYFVSSEHAAIIRKTNECFEYLELQNKKKKNGFRTLTGDVLDDRFGTKKKSTCQDYLIDIEKIKDSPNFRELLGFFNTQVAE